MGFIDYSRIGAPTYGKEIRGLGDDLFEAMKYGAEKRKLDEQERHNKALEAYNQSISANQANSNARLVKVEEDKNSRENNKVARDAVAMARRQLGEGDTAGAKATLAAAGISDAELHNGPSPSLGEAPPDPGEEPKPSPNAVAPAAAEVMSPPVPEANAYAQRLHEDQANEIDSATGKSYAVAPAAAAVMSPGSVPPGPGPQGSTEPPPFDPSAPAPVPAPPAPPAAPPAGSVPPPIEDPGSDPESLQAYQRYQSDIRAYRDRKAAADKYNEERANLPSAQREYQNSTVHELSLPNGQKVKFNEGEARHEVNVTAARDMEDTLMPDLINKLGQARALGGVEGAHAEAEVNRRIGIFQTHLAAVASGAEKKDIAMRAYREDVRDGTHEARIRDIAKEANETKIEVAKMRPAQTQTKEAISESHLALSEDDAFRKRADDLNREYNTPKDMVAYRGLSHAVENAASSNTLLQSGVKFNLARALQGVGPLTDRDLDRLRAQPGIGSKLESMAKGLEDGTLGEAEQKTLLDASARMFKQKEADLQAGVRAYHNLYNTSLPWMGRLGKGYLDAEGAARFGDAWFAPGGVADLPSRQTGRSGISTRRRHSKMTTAPAPAAPASGTNDPYKGLLDQLDKAAGR